MRWVRYVLMAAVVAALAASCAKDYEQRRVSAAETAARIDVFTVVDKRSGDTIGAYVRLDAACLFVSRSGGVVEVACR